MHLWDEVYSIGLYDKSDNYLFCDVCGKVVFIVGTKQSESISPDIPWYYRLWYSVRSTYYAIREMEEPE